MIRSSARHLHRSSILGALFVALSSGQSLSAQVANVPVPDTLGANFNSDSVGVGSPGDYDFLEGKWTLMFQTRRATGEFSPPVQGTWHAYRTHEGRMAEDEFSLASPTDGSRSLTLTYRAFSAASKTWQMSGISLSGGSPWAVGETWSDRDHRYAVQHYGPLTVRIKYYAITANHFLWRADATRDGGKTWVRDYWRLEATRAAP